MKKTLALAALVFAAGIAPSFAEDLCKDISARKSEDEAKAAAVKAGYTDISSMGEDDGCYEAKGLNADGTKFEVYIHPTTLEIVKVKTEG
jgi:hypothetical protein